MSLIDLIKNSFAKVVENPTTTLILVVFLLGVNFIIPAIFTTTNKLTAILLISCLFMLCCSFLAGWFQVIKETKGEIKDKNFFAIFFEGAGKNLIKTIIAIILYFVFFTLMVFIARHIALKVFGSLDFLFLDIRSIASDNSSLMQYFNNLTDNQKYTILGWQMSFIWALTVFNFLSLFYFPAVFYSRAKNQFLVSFIALIDNIVFTFKNFFPVLLIFILINFIHFILAVLNALFANNALMSLILLFIYIYFICMGI